MLVLLKGLAINWAQVLCVGDLYKLQIDNIVVEVKYTQG